ncbi:MAG: hypothetical protein SGBAC_010292, partial [Bacillariaceae sp.]
MDLVDVAVLAKNAKSIAKQTVNSSAAENRKFLASTVSSTANRGVKIVGKTQFGETLLDGGKFMGKTASAGVKIVGKTHLGGAVLDGGKLVGGAAMMVGGTLTDTITDGAGLVGGAVLGGADLLGKTAMMGTELLGEGIHMLMGDDNASAFFHEDPETLEGYDIDDFDEVTPDRFKDPDKKEKEVKATMKVEWDEHSWGQYDGDPEGHLPAIVVDKTVSQRKLEIEKEKEARANNGDSDEESSVESDKTEDIYFTAKEIRAKEKAAKRERKRLKKERKRMSQIARKEAKQKEEEKEMKAQADEDAAFGALGKSFSLLIPQENAQAMMPSDGTNAEAMPIPPIRSLEIAGQQPSENMDGIQKKMRSKTLWGKLRKNVAQRGIVKAFESNVQQKQDFFDAFGDDDTIDGIADPMGDATALLSNEHDTEKDKVHKLRKQLDDYEANLDKERKEVEEERKRIATEKKELETQFKLESERNADLTKQSQVLKKELDVELDKKNANKLQRELEELRAENEVLQEQVEKQDTILRQLHREKAIREKRAKRKQLYGGDQPRSSSATIQTFRSLGAGSVFDDEATVVTYVAKSRRSSNMKVMEENLEEMTDELEARQKVIEMQVMELENLHKQLKESEDKSGIKPLRDEFLELQKQKEEVEKKADEEKAALALTLEAKQEAAAKLAAEISRLKLEHTKKELKATQEVEPPAENGGLFGMLW